MELEGLALSLQRQENPPYISLIEADYSFLKPLVQGGPHQRCVPDLPSLGLGSAPDLVANLPCTSPTPHARFWCLSSEGLPDLVLTSSEVSAGVLDAGIELK